MKSFKEFIRENDSIEENRLARTFAGLALGTATIAGLQGGAMHHTEQPSISRSSTSVETRGDETRSATSSSVAFAKKGKPTGYSHRGFFDLGSRTVTDTAQGKPTQSNFNVTLKNPSGVSSVSRTQIGGKTVNTSGDYSKVGFKSNVETSGPVVSSKSTMQTSRGPLTTGATPSQIALGIGGAAGGLAALGRAIRRRN